MAEAREVVVVVAVEMVVSEVAEGQEEDAREETVAEVRSDRSTPGHRRARYSMHRCQS